MLDCKLSRNEKATIMDATPRMTQDMERSSGFSPRLASRSAMLQTHFLKIDFIIANLLANVQHSTTCFLTTKILARQSRNQIRKRIFTTKDAKSTKFESIKKNESFVAFVRFVVRSFFVYPAT